MDLPDICDLAYGVNPMQSFKATPKTDGDQGKDLAFVFSQGVSAGFIQLHFENKANSMQG